MAPHEPQVKFKVDTIADLHHASERLVTRHQRLVEGFTSQLGRPRTLYVLLAIVAIWIVLNGFRGSWGWSPSSSPP